VQIREKHSPLHHKLEAICQQTADQTRQYLSNIRITDLLNHKNKDS
jgi:hypothetical protein